MLPPLLPKKKKRTGRIRCPAHLAWVRKHKCCVGSSWCDAKIEAAHVRLGTDGSMGVKPGDQWAISLCRDHHAQQHQLGEERFANKFRLDLLALAQEFAAKSPHRNKLRGD